MRQNLKDDNMHLTYAWTCISFPSKTYLLLSRALEMLKYPCICHHYYCQQQTATLTQSTNHSAALSHEVQKCVYTCAYVHIHTNKHTHAYCPQTQMNVFTVLGISPCCVLEAAANFTSRGLTSLSRSTQLEQRREMGAGWVHNVSATTAFYLPQLRREGTLTFELCSLLFPSLSRPNLFFLLKQPMYLEQHRLHRPVEFGNPQNKLCHLLSQDLKKKALSYLTFGFVGNP